jgi:hypothetical protein
MSNDTPTDLEVVQMRGQCNRVRLGLHPDDKHAMILAYQHGLLVQEGARLVLTDKGDKFCTDLTGNLPA